MGGMDTHEVGIEDSHISEIHNENTLCARGNTLLMNTVLLSIISVISKLMFRRDHFDTNVVEDYDPFESSAFIAYLIQIDSLL